MAVAADNRPVEFSPTDAMTKVSSDEGTDALSFLKDFGAQEHQDASLAEEARTEVHDNTTKGRIHRQNHHQAVATSELQTPLASKGDQNQKHLDEFRTESPKLCVQEPREEVVEGAAAPAPARKEAAPIHKSGDETEQEPDRPSIPGIQSYPSYYDNPYVNPYASAVKPNDLFRNKDQGTTIDSEINSNCSEFGTVVGAPSLMADRFTEVDSMEREVLAMQNVENIFTEEKEEEDSEDTFDDPDLANYKAFRVDNTNHEDEQSTYSEEDSAQFHTPSAISKVEDPTKSSEVLSTASQMGTVVRENQERERLADIETMTANMTSRNHNHEEDGQSECESSHGLLTATKQLQQAPSSQIQTTAIFRVSLPIREADQYETALSVVDSEIDQLIRQTSSEHSGKGVIKSFNSNNSAEGFRAPSGGSLADTVPQHQQNDKHLSPIANVPDDNEDGELDAINGDRPHDACALSASERRKIRPSSSLRRALTLAQKQMEDSESQCKLSDHELHQREDQKEEKDDGFRGEPDRQDQQQQYHFQVVPLEEKAMASCDEGSTIQLVGAKFSKRPTPSTSSVSRNQFFFDIEDDEQETRNNGTKSPRDLLPLLKGDHENNQELSKSQESSRQPPTMGGSTEGSHTQQPDKLSTLLLKSPGASTHLMADFTRESSNSGNAGTGNIDGQRATGWQHSILNSGSFASLPNAPLAIAAARNQKFQPQPLRYARGCRSFDTTTDRRYDYKLQYGRDAAAKDYQVIKSSQSCESRHPVHAPASRASSSSFRHSSNGEERDSNKTKVGTPALYRSSQSWDIGSSIWSATAGTGATDVPETECKEAMGTLSLDASAFRFAPYVRNQGHQHPHPHGYSSGSRLVTGERQEKLRLMSDAPQAITARRQLTENLELLQTPQRIEIEREDALNLLACLCERGVALNDPAGQIEAKGILKKKQTPETGEETKKLKFNAASGMKQKYVNSSQQLEPETVNEAVSVLREMSRDRYQSGVESTETSSPTYHLVRMQVLDELMSSHTYALEMKRAALSASAWLRSIGHSDNLREEDSRTTLATTEQAAGESERSNRGGSNGTADNASVLSLKALLHQAQMEIDEKDQALSKCRAEIGRLKSASQNKTSFTSPNRSILDDDSVSENDDLVAGEETDGRIADESMVDLDSSLFANEGHAGEEVRDSDQPLARELKMYKSALHDANAIIRKLHGELQDATLDKEVHAREAPQIEVSQKAFSIALMDESTSNIEKTSNSFADQHAENRTVNVRMLDGENFLTDWQIAESLPPPPDHGLRSPIVDALLSQWSPDETLHNSLLEWMDNVMINGANPNTVPPLTLSSLDHQVRDGFMMHVLPLLLRRSDVLVDIKTRAHRKTTYDVAVSIKSNTGVAGSSGRHLESVSSRQNAFAACPDTSSVFGSIAHRAITAQARNSDCTKDVYDMGITAASYATFGNGYTTLVPRRPSDEKCVSPQRQAGLMSALGGALGGFLSRRKLNSSFYDAGLAGSYDMGSAVGAAGPGPMDFPQEGSPQITAGTGEQEPYHRLVSAPPGRIGVSFVEYRGHAMVSDVSSGSPLLGWIFPSDILIAIDEVPVSGMKLKDIVKVLQARNERQRAMRVISSHAMQDFAVTPNTTPS